MTHTAPIDIMLPEVGEDGGTIPVFARWFGSWKVSVQRRTLSAGDLAIAYDREAASWDRTIQQLGFSDAYETMLRQALPDEIGEDRGTPLRVFDAGIGTGGLSKALARVGPLPLDLSGIDISPGMLSEANRNLGEVGLSADLRLGDVQHLPYENATFDIVMAVHVLEHLANPHRAIEQMVRVLKPGGVLLACLTRCSSLGMYIHLKWRTHRVTAEEAERWFARHGLERSCCLRFERHSRCRNLSLACIGGKPLA